MKQNRNLLITNQHCMNVGKQSKIPLWFYCF